MVVCIVLLSIGQICLSVALILHLVSHRKELEANYDPYGYTPSRDLI